MKRFLAGLMVVGLSACSSVPIQEKPSSSAPAPSSGRVDNVKDYSEWEKAPQGTGYYLDDGPGTHRPTGLLELPDAIPVVEPIAEPNKRRYTVMGLTFQPQQTLEEPYRQKGHASWYGRKFHGAKTANGEIYDMYQMTAAHPTLPLPSYARVTNLSNNKQVIVRVNDRGPFLRGRIIDLSYAAALKLDYINQGSAEVLVEKLTPELIAELNSNKTRVASENSSSGSDQVAIASPIQRTPQAINYGADRAVLDQSAVSQPIDEAALQGQAAPIGSATTSVQVLKASVDPAPGSNATKVAPKLDTPIFLQVGAFGSADNAKSLSTQLKADFPDFATIIEVVETQGLHRVVAGPFASQEAANEAAIGFTAQAGLTPVVKEGLNLQ